MEDGQKQQATEEEEEERLELGSGGEEEGRGKSRGATLVGHIQDERKNVDMSNYDELRTIVREHRAKHAQTTLPPARVQLSKVTVEVKVKKHDQEKRRSPTLGDDFILTRFYRWIKTNAKNRTRQQPNVS